MRGGVQAWKTKVQIENYPICTSASFRALSWQQKEMEKRISGKWNSTFERFIFNLRKESWSFCLQNKTLFKNKNTAVHPKHCLRVFALLQQFHWFLIWWQGSSFQFNQNSLDLWTWIVNWYKSIERFTHIGSWSISFFTITLTFVVLDTRCLPHPQSSLLGYSAPAALFTVPEGWLATKKIPKSLSVINYCQWCATHNW